MNLIPSKTGVNRSKTNGFGIQTENILFQTIFLVTSQIGIIQVVKRTFCIHS